MKAAGSRSVNVVSVFKDKVLQTLKYCLKYRDHCMKAVSNQSLVTGYIFKNYYEIDMTFFHFLQTNALNDI